MKCTRQLLVLLGTGILFVLPLAAMATEEGTADAAHLDVASTFLWMAVLLIAAKCASLVERAGQPAVLGGLVVGVALPFVLGTYIVGPILLPGLSSNTYLFLGAALTATSVGITARVFQDLGKLQSREAQIVLGAAVIDDVLGLIILAVVSAIAKEGSVDIGGIGLISGKAILFLVGSIAIGQFFAPLLGKSFSKIHAGVGMKFTLAICFGLVLAALAQKIGLAPIVGAFAAGLVLDPVHFRYFKDPKIVRDIREAVQDAPAELQARVSKIIEHHADRHIEEIIEPLGHFLVPIFFVMTGMAVSLETMFDLPVLLFASIGKGLGVISDTVYSVLIIVIIITTLCTPPMLTFLLKRNSKAMG